MKGLFLISALVFSLSTLVYFSCKYSSGKVPAHIADSSKTTPVKDSNYKPLLVLDAGHGGVDPGSINDSLNLYEKNVARHMVDELKKLIDTSKIRIVETRPQDSNIHRHSRIDMASSLNPDLLLSFHTNFDDDTTVNGYEISYCDSLFMKCTPADTIRGLNPFRKDLNKWSQVLNDHIHRKFPTMRQRHIAVRKDDIWIISGGSNFPAILLEFGFISNRHDVGILNDKKYIKKYAAAVAQGIKDILLKKETASNNKTTGNQKS